MEILKKNIFFMGKKCGVLPCAARKKERKRGEKEKLKEVAL